jgi:hypothetical protein
MNTPLQYMPSLDFEAQLRSRALEKTRSVYEQLNFWGKFAVRDNFGIPALLHYYLMEDKAEGETRLRRFLQNCGDMSDTQGLESLRNKIRRGFGEKCLVEYLIRLFQYGSYQFPTVKAHLEIIFSEKKEVLLLFSKILIRDKIVTKSKQTIELLKKMTTMHPSERDFFMHYFENIINIPEHRDINSELRYRVSKLLDEDKYENLYWFVKNRQKFKDSQWCKGLMQSLTAFDVNDLDDEDLSKRINFVSERKKFISVREGHGEWLDGELLRGLTDTVFLGIRKMNHVHIEGLRLLGECLKDFGKKLGYKGLGLLVIGNSILLNVNCYKTRIDFMDARKALWSSTLTVGDYDWKMVSLCEQRGGMDLEEVMQRVVWVTRGDNEKKLHDWQMEDAKAPLMDRLRFTRDSFKKTLNQNIAEEDKRALFYYYTCSGIHESKRNNMLLQHLVEDPEMTLKYLFIEDGKGNVLIDGLLKNLLSQRKSNNASNNREFLMKKIVDFLGNKNFSLPDIDRLYFELGWAFVGQKSDFSFTMEVLEKIPWKMLIKVRENDSILLKSMRNWRLFDISKD